VKRTDLAYVAGIIDGEGCISLTRSKNEKGIQVHVQIDHTNEWLLQWLKFAFGGVVTLRHDKREEIKGWKSMYCWRLRTAEALEFLKLIYPYLRLKKVQAEIAIKVLEMRGKKGRRFTESETAVAEAQRIIMSKLNKTGRTNWKRGD
jgi:hypothetical protein